MIVLFFPPEEREVAISVFGASGALANGSSHLLISPGLRQRGS